jgi:ferric-dicitrate binding protein FerR (iron transport regulator)
MNEDQYNLISKILSGEASEAEIREMNNWINQSEENKADFEKISEIWKGIETPQPKTVPEFSDFWRSLSAKMDVYNKGKVHLIKKRRIKYGSLAIAATVLIIMGSLFLFKLFDTTQSVKTAVGERKTINLQDGSVIIMNNDSEISYPGKFDEEKREVFLKGQAFFQVAEQGSPFIVQTSVVNVHVLGTSFDVKSRMEQTKVIVKSGRVMVSSLLANENEKLKENEMVRIQKDGKIIKTTHVDADYLLGWMNDKFIFDKTPLIEIKRELERYYGISIVVDENIESMELTGEFSNQPAQEVIDLICLALNLRYQSKNNEFVIFR